MQPPRPQLPVATPQVGADVAGQCGGGQHQHQHQAGGDRRALEKLHLVLAFGQLLGGDVVAGQPADPAADEIGQHQPVPAALHAAGIGQRGRGHAEGNHVGQRVQFPAQGRGRFAPARHAAVQGIEHEGQRDQRHAQQQVAHPPVLQEAHRREDRAGAAERIGQGEPVGQLEIAQHREVAGHAGAMGRRWSQPLYPATVAASTGPQAASTPTCGHMRCCAA